MTRFPFNIQHSTFNIPLFPLCYNSPAIRQLEDFPLQVELTRSPRLSKMDNVYVLAAQSDDGGTYPALPEDLAAIVTRAARRAGFAGRTDEVITFLPDSGPRKVTLVGLGKECALASSRLRSAIYSIAKISRKGRDEKIAAFFPWSTLDGDAHFSTRLISDLLTHSDYRYDNYVTVREDGPPKQIHCTLTVPEGLSPREMKAVKAEADALARAVATVRDLGNAPPNEVTPTRLAERAAEVAKESGISCTIFDRKRIEKLKMGGLLAVNRGSAEEPRFVVMEHKPKKFSKTVCLVGKGITFDSGGISIKPSEKMEEMKYDMCGAATVIGTMQAAAQLDIPVRVIGIFASTDNLPSGSAYKPGDIITMMSGKTVEIVNTDAEGRMILGDALHYAKKFDPDHLIDYATLTGACVVALGSAASGLFSNDSELAQKLIDAGEKVGERLWRMPEWDDYKELIRSEWADMKNSGGRWGGASTAALFLKEFVDCRSWAHLDIAGTAYVEESARGPRGATGAGVRATIQFLQSLDS